MKIPKHSPGSVLFALLSWTAAASAAAQPPNEPPMTATSAWKPSIASPHTSRAWPQASPSARARPPLASAHPSRAGRGLRG